MSYAKDRINFKNDISVYDLMNIFMISIWLIGFFYTFCSIWIYGIGTILLSYAIVLYVYANRTKNWVQTPCKVLSTSTDTYELIRLLQRFATTVYAPKIRYQYAIDGKTYEQYSIRPIERSSWFLDKDAAHSFVQRLTRQKETVTYVNPKNPSQAVLYKELSGTTFFHLIGALICGVIPMLIGFFCETIPFLVK